MKQLALILTTFVCSISNNAQSFRLSFETGAEIVNQNKLLLSAPLGIFLSQTNNSVAAPSPHLTVLGEYALKNFHFAAGVGIEQVAFDFTARRAAWIPSMQGEYYYEADELYTGRQTLLRIPVRADYFFFKRNDLHIGVSAGATFNQIFRYKVTSGYEYSSESNYYYANCNLGPVFEADLKIMSIAFRPSVQYIVAQTNNSFKELGGFVNVDVSIPLGRKADTKE